MSIENDSPLGEILVMFPASKNFAPEVSATPDPTDELRVELSRLDNSFERKLNIEVPTEGLTLRQITQGLEMRIHMLDDISDRLKFYIDDLEVQLIKK